MDCLTPVRVPSEAHDNDLTTRRVEPSPARRRSWGSFDHNLSSDTPLSKCSQLSVASERMEPESLTALPSTSHARSAYARPEPSFDMAFYLKNTGPPLPFAGKARANEKPRPRYKSGLKLLRKRRPRGAVQQGDSKSSIWDDDFPLTAFKPVEGVIQRVSKSGKPYLQIVTENTVIDRQERKASSGDLANETRIPTAVSDRTDAVGTDAFDTWISTLDRKQVEMNAEAPSTGSTSAGAERDSTSASDESTLYRYSASWFSSFAENRLALRIDDAPKVGTTCAAATDATAALRSNPLTPRPSMVKRKSQSSRAVSQTDEWRAKNARMQQRYSREHRTVISSSIDRPTSDRLAGQGMRRPLPEQMSSTDCTATLPNDAVPSVSNGESQHLRKDSGRASSQSDHFSSTPTGDVRAGAIHLTRKIREEKIRARKLRDLYRTRQNIDAVVTSPFGKTGLQVRDSLLTSKLSSRSASAGAEHNYSQGFDPLIDQLALRPPSRGVDAATPGYETGYTPRSGCITLSPIMLVAQQIPVPQGRHVKRPARLVLREPFGRNRSGELAVAVRAITPSEESEWDHEGSGKTEAKRETEGKSAESILTGDEAPPESACTNTTMSESAGRFKTEQHPSTPVEAVFQSQHPLTMSASPRPLLQSVEAPQAVMGQQDSTGSQDTADTAASPSARNSSALPLASESTTHAHHRSPTSPLQITASRLAAPPSCPPAAAPTSTARPPSTSQLEARLAVLESSNRLLEAALMAILKAASRGEYVGGLRVGAGLVGRCGCGASVGDEGLGVEPGVGAEAGCLES